MGISSWSQDPKRRYSKCPATCRVSSVCNKIQSSPQDVNRHAASFIDKVLLWKTLAPGLTSVLSDITDSPLGARPLPPWRLVKGR